MGLNTLLKSTVFTLKMYRLYWANMLSVMLVLPLTYLAVVTLFSGGSPESLLIGLTGFTVMVCFTTMVYPVALQVANMFEEQVLEIYASLPVSLRELLVSTVISQLVFSAPAIAVSLVALKALATTVDTVYVVVSVVLSLLFFSALAVALGLVFKSRYKLDSLLTVLMMLLVVATPLYYKLGSVEGYLKIALLVNPVTHMVCLLREGVGVSEGVSPWVSAAYLVVASITLVVLVFYKTRVGVLTVLERR